jgi:hypothetical protein
LLEDRVHPDLKFKNFSRVTTDGKQRNPEPLKILDLCSGSGCISLLLYSMLAKEIPNIKICGQDISEKAHKLSLENLRDAEQNHFHAPCPIEFRRRDIFDDETGLQIDPQSKTVDVIVSNPPYISEKAFNRSTSRSARNFEPRMALVPSPPKAEDRGFFYRRLIELHKHFKSRLLVMEVSGKSQALQVAKLAQEMCGQTDLVMIWRDQPDPNSHPGGKILAHVGGSKLPVYILGQGVQRAVVLLRVSPRMTGDEDGIGGNAASIKAKEIAWHRVRKAWGLQDVPLAGT